MVVNDQNVIRTFRYSKFMSHLPSGQKRGTRKKLNLPKFPLVDWNTLDQAMQYFVKDLFRYEYS